MQDSPKPPDLAQARAPSALTEPIEATTEPPIEFWWRRSPALAAGAALAIGLASLWFGNMLGRVPLDAHSTFGYLLMLPLLLIVPAFSAAGLKLAWIAWWSGTSLRWAVRSVAFAGMAANLFAITAFVAALLRIFRT